jgi:hypothetical protein
MNTTLRQFLFLSVGAAVVFMGCSPAEQSVERRSAELTISPSATRS